MVILDLETTGGKATYHRIIEVGLLLIDSGEVTKVWRSFINPDTSISTSINRITGISEPDVLHAPYFQDVAQELLGYLEDRVLVAHNARFDYGFLKNEYKRLGINYAAKPLCSVKLSRQLYPEYKRHSLDAIISRFKLNVDSRHRAFDDAKAVYDFFLKTSALKPEEDVQSICQSILSNPTIPSHLNNEEVKKLPKAPGVYYFYNKQNKLLYVGKSVNIRSRVMNHFSQDHSNPKDLKMSSQIAHLDFCETPSDFGAQLLESNEIKKLYPIYNHRLRKTKELYRYRVNEDALGYIRINTEAAGLAQNSDDIGLFRSKRQAQKVLAVLADRYQLCHQLIGLESLTIDQNKPCFRYQLKKCLGACCQQESVADYNARLKQALSEYMVRTWPYQGAVLVQEAPVKVSDEEGEPSYHLLDNWCYLANLDNPYDVSNYGFELSNQEATIRIPQLLSEPEHKSADTCERFDLDTYFILARFLLNPEMMIKNRLKVFHLAKLP